MLTVLELRDFVLAKAVRLEFGAGLHAFTGETGAGKSILVDALSLLTGGRADAAQIREGAQRALVQAEFTGDGPASAARTLVANGRNDARIDGEVVTVSELAHAVGARVSVFAQHAQQALLSPAAQRDAVDRLLGADGRAALSEYRTVFARRAVVAADLARLREAERDAARRADLLGYQIAEIDEAELVPGEEDALAEEAERLRHAERIAEGTARALAALDDEDGATSSLAAARRDLADAVRHDSRLEPLARDLADALAGAQAVASELQTFLDGFEADPRRLDEVQARLARIDRLRRKYGTTTTEVLAFRDACRAEFAEIEGAGYDRRRLESEDEALAARLADLARAVGRARREAGDRLEREIAPLLARLALEGARLGVELEPVDFGPHGAERVRLRFGANVGEKTAPLAQAASGGELSRVMLALWLVSGTDGATLVFDEVDAGVGGRAARAVGELLAELATRHQVVIVTHLPQVASFADVQYHVGKETRGGRTITTVERLDRAGRERELARMLAGTESEAALHAARDLLSQARYDSSESPANSASTSSSFE